MLKAVWSIVHVDTRPTRCCGPRKKNVSFQETRGFPCRLRKPEIHLLNFCDPVFQKLAWTLVKSCIKCDSHFSFLTCIRSYSGMFWRFITHTGMNIDTGLDMTGFSGLQYQEPNLIVITVQSRTRDWNYLCPLKLYFAWIKNVFPAPKGTQRQFKLFPRSNPSPGIV